MGYRRIPTVHTLDSIKGEEGLVVRMKSIRLGKLRKMMKLSAESEQESEELFVMFQESLISWNLEDENGHPVPTTMDGVDDQEPELIMAIVEEWMDRLTGTNGPGDLGKDSTAGEKFPGQPLTMEAL